MSFDLMIGSNEGSRAPWQSSTMFYNINKPLFAAKDKTLHYYGYKEFMF